MEKPPLLPLTTEDINMRLGQMVGFAKEAMRENGAIQAMFDVCLVNTATGKRDRVGIIVTGGHPREGTATVVGKLVEDHPDSYVEQVTIIAEAWATEQTTGNRHEIIVVATRALDGRGGAVVHDIRRHDDNATLDETTVKELYATDEPTTDEEQPILADFYTAYAEALNKKKDPTSL